MAFTRTNVFCYCKLKAQEKHLYPVPMCFTTKSSHCSKYMRKNRFTTRELLGFRRRCNPGGHHIRTTVSSLPVVGAVAPYLEFQNENEVACEVLAHTVAPTNLPETPSTLHLKHPPPSFLETICLSQSMTHFKMLSH